MAKLYSQQITPYSVSVDLSHRRVLQHPTQRERRRNIADPLTFASQRDAVIETAQESAKQTQSGPSSPVHLHSACFWLRGDTPVA
jgi:hypothetical protein